MGAALPLPGPVTAHSCLWGCCDTRAELKPCSSRDWVLQSSSATAAEEWAVEVIETQTASGVLEQAVSELGDSCPEKSGIPGQLWDLFLSWAHWLLIVIYWGLLFVHFTRLLWNLWGWIGNAESICFQKRKKYGCRAAYRFKICKFCFLEPLKYIFCTHFLSILEVWRILLSNYLFWGGLCENNKKRETHVWQLPIFSSMCKGALPNSISSLHTCVIFFFFSKTRKSLPCSGKGFIQIYKNK